MKNYENENTIIENENGEITFSITLTEKYKKEKEKARRYYERRKKRLIRRRKFNSFRSVLYVIFGGLYSAILAVCLGIAYCATIIGIPFGIAYFKSVKLMFNPINKRVVLHYGKHPILNTFWLLTGGFAIFLIYSLIGLALCLTGVFYFSGNQFFKFSRYFLAPFGADTLSRYEFTSEFEKKNYYTYLYIKRNDINVLDKKLLLTQNSKLTSNERRIKRTFYQKYFNLKRKILNDFCSICCMTLLLFLYTGGEIGFYSSITLLYFVILAIICISFCIYGDILSRGLNYGYANVTDLIDEVYGKPIVRGLYFPKASKDECMKYYLQHSNEIDEFIAQEYVY